MAGGAKYQPYPAYKPSGVEWLGNIPEGWSSGQIKNAYNIKLGKMLQKDPKTSSDVKLPYLKAMNIQPSGLSLEKVDEMWFSEGEVKSLQLALGDVIISEGGDVGRSTIWDGSIAVCGFQNAINRARPKGNSSPNYLYYWMITLKASEYIDILCNKATIAHYTTEKLETSPVFMPPLSEQTKIAAFLDHETAKIDALIAKQQRLIALLEEKRQAVISHAVIKGLNPSAPLRPSGIDWLGEVPEHWDLSVKFAYLTNNDRHAFVNGPFGSDLLSSELREEGVPVIYSGDIRRNKFKKKSNSFVTLRKAETLAFCKVTSGDLLLAKVGAPPGVASVYPSGFPDGIVTQDVVKVDLDDLKVSTKYLCFLLNSESGKFLVRNISVESTRGRFSLGDLKAIRFFLPPVREQIQITKFIERQTDVFDELMPKAQSAITLLKERRIALISAAVTGKIDLRDWQPPASASTSTAEISKDEFA